MKPLVSIIIPAYNAEKWIGYTLESAVAQTWRRKEIIVIDDGSTDRTAQVARRFASREVSVVSTVNQGLSGAVNLAFRLCEGDYIQELDADDILAPDKIERQLAALREDDGNRVLLSSPWAYFYYRTRNVRFIQNSLCESLSPVDWLSRKMNENLHMQNATWLVSRELAKAAGPWDETLHYDQDGEYFARVLMCSQGTRFVPGTGVYYRASGTGSVSYIGSSERKKESLFRSMMSQMRYLQRLEQSERVRQACLIYMQNWYGVFYPGRPDLAERLQRAAAELGGQLKPPSLRWKYAWIQPLFGWRAAARAQMALPQIKSSWIRFWDKALYRYEGLRRNVSSAGPAPSATPGN